MVIGKDISFREEGNLCAGGIATRVNASMEKISSINESSVKKPHKNQAIASNQLSLLHLPISLSELKDLS
jgi:hypothetical protein